MDDILQFCKNKPIYVLVNFNNKNDSNEKKIILRNVNVSYRHVYSLFYWLLADIVTDCSVRQTYCFSSKSFVTENVSCWKIKRN